MDQKSAGLNITVFFCQQLDANQDINRRVLEKELGPRIRFFPLPCSGRIEPLHLLSALESGADMVYLVTCPDGVCRYQEGNVRARKRLMYAQKLIEEMGLERERIELVVTTDKDLLTIDELTRGLILREAIVDPSPVRVKKHKGKYMDSYKGVRK
ncbi:MAG: hydrogenase iron-sulfur subunit [Proteobacteria bacterium]|nr:hydrogenase iron-sulfur subunit [Pseudomonadota bacterium]